MASPPRLVPIPIRTLVASLASSAFRTSMVSASAYCGLAEYQSSREPGPSSAARSRGSQPPATPAAR